MGWLGEKDAVLETPLSRTAPFGDRKAKVHLTCQFSAIEPRFLPVSVVFKVIGYMIRHADTNYGCVKVINCTPEVVI